MRNAHAIAKHTLSFKTYEILCRLDKQKNIDLGTQYLHDKAAAKFCESITHTCRNEVVEKLLACKFCSVTCDGSTDFMGEDLENLYLRTSTNCKVEDTFLYIGSADGASSEAIHHFILEVFKTLNIEDQMQKKLVGFCTDGAANMQGLKHGLAALMKKQWPHLVFSHCLAHRLELSFKDAIKKSAPKQYEKATTLLLGLYYLFRKSPKQKNGLQRAFEILGMKQLLPTRIGGTRWLPHYQRALQVFTRYQLENSSHDNPKAEGLAKLMKDGHVLVYLLSLKRIITNLTSLSLYLQQQEISLAGALTRVKSTQTTLQQIVEKEDSSISSVVAMEKYQDEPVVFRGKTPEAESYQSSLVHALVEALESRFQPGEFTNATMISSLRNWPQLQISEIKETYFGEEAVSVLYHHFSSVLESKSDEISLERILDEWSTLRSLVYTKYSAQLETNSLTWQSIYRDLSDQQLNNIFMLIDILLALPPTSVNNETAFSAMKLLKTKRRGRLSSARLNDLMTIKLTSPDIEQFNHDPAILHWMTSTPSGQKRRKERKPAAVSSKATVVTVSDDESDEVAEPEAYEQRPGPSSVTGSTTEPYQGLCNKDVDVNDGDSEDDEDNDMSEDTVFSLLLTFRE